MKVLISGHKGFMGGYLYKKLESLGHTVMGMDKKEGMTTSNFGTINRVVMSFKPDIIVHLGANCSSQVSLREPYVDFVDNAQGTFNVCEASRIAGNIPIIFNSSMKVYPGADGIIPPYGLSKIVGQSYLKMYHDVYGVDYIVNRPSSVYGPGQDASGDGGWVTWFCMAKAKNKEITLFGDGTQSRDILYIDDCVDLLVDQVQNFNKWKNNEYDFGGGIENEISVNEVLDFIKYHNTVQGEKLKGDVQRFVCSNDLVNKMGWKPKVSWREGIERTLQWAESL